MDTKPPIRPSLTTPSGFCDFWRETLDELRATPCDIEAESFSYPVYRQLQGHRLRFSSLGHVKLRGYSISWKDDEPRPLVIHAHGYGGRVAEQWLWALSGFNVVGFDVRGFGGSLAALPERSDWGWMLTGIDNSRHYVLRGAVCDYIRASQVAAEMFGDRTRRTIFHGFSFSGALALMSQAVTRSANVLAIGVPTFGWHEGRLKLVVQGSAVEVRRYLEARPSDRDRVMHTLSFFDSMNFAPFIKCPTLAGYGRRDIVVPPETVLAIVSRLSCPCETMSLPVSHTDEPEEAAWKHFDGAWIEMATHGVPANFGRDAPVYHIDSEGRM